MSLCFMDAFRAKKKGNITEEEYIRHLLAHCKGVAHEEDEKTGVWVELSEKDPFGYSVRCWALDMSPLEDTTPIENVFAAYRTKSVDEVKDSLAQLSDQLGPSLRKSLSMLALQDRRPDVLKLCLDQGGFAYEHYFEDVADQVNAADDPETFEVLEKSRFRQIYPRKKRRTSKKKGGNSGGDTEKPGSSGKHSKPKATKPATIEREAADWQKDQEFRTRAAAEFDKDGKFPVDW